MAKDKRSAGPNQPLSQATDRHKGQFIIYTKRGTRIAAKWPRKRPEPPSPAQLQQREEFKKLAIATKNVTAEEQLGAREIAAGSYYTWRDVLSRAMVGRLVEMPNYGEIVSQYNLDILGSDLGMIVVRALTEWVALNPGSDGQVLTIVSGAPAWVTPVDTGITQLTGPVTAGPGSGSQVSALTATGVTAGTYSRATLTVAADGRLSSAADGAADAGITQLTGDVTAGPGNGSQASALANTGVAAGSYTALNATVDAKGRITAASNGSFLPAAVAVHPGYKSGAFYTPWTSAQIGAAATVTANQIYALPLYLGVGCTLDTVRIRVGASIALSSAEMGLYTNNAGIPDQLIADLGNVSTASTGERVLSGLARTLTAGWYWIVVAFSHAPSAVQLSLTNAFVGNFMGLPNTLAANNPYTGYIGAWTFSAGNLPATFPSPVRSTVGMPAIFFTVP